MAEFDAMLRELFGDSINRLDQFQKDQVSRITQKVHEIVRGAVREELQKLTAEVSDLRARVARLEAERVEATDHLVD